MEGTIGRIAKQSGVSADTLRYYEREGLLSPPDRSPSGYRQYPETIVDRLRLIKGAQRVGLHLREIKELLTALDRGLCPCGHTEAMIRGRIAEVDREMKRLEEVRAELGRMLDQLPQGCEDGSGSPWPCETTFIEIGKGVSRCAVPARTAAAPAGRHPARAADGRSRRSWG